jgi:hypothetical protein
MRLPPLPGFDFAKMREVADKQTFDTLINQPELAHYIDKVGNSSRNLETQSIGGNAIICLLAGSTRGGAWGVASRLKYYLMWGLVLTLFACAGPGHVENLQGGAGASFLGEEGGCAAGQGDRGRGGQGGQAVGRPLDEPPV